MLKGIRAPLRQLTAATHPFRRGKLDARTRHFSANEFGKLSDTFGSMAGTIETEIEINGHAAQLAGVMLRKQEGHSFRRELLKGLLQHTASQVGAVYFLNEAKGTFEHFESIGLGDGGRVSFSAAELEGELGTALATHQIQRIKNIPADEGLRSIPVIAVTASAMQGNREGILARGFDDYLSKSVDRETLKQTCGNGWNEKAIEPRNLGL